MEQFLQLTLGGIRIGVVYGLVALGLVVVYKSTRLVNFAHGAFVMVGAYVGALVVSLAGGSFAFQVAVGALASAVFAGVSERTVLRPLRRLDAFGAVIATVAYAVLLMALARVRYGSTILSVPGPGSTAPIDLGPVVITTQTVLTIVVSIALGLATVLFFRFTRAGTVLRAVADNPTGAELCGYRLDRVQTGAWALSGALAGAAGVIVAPITGVTPDLMLLIVPAFVVAVIGGFESLVGVLIGGVLIGVVETYVAGYFSTGGKEAIGLLAMLLVLYFRPQGLFAELEVTKV